MTPEHDVVIIGAGFSGLYAVHKFRDELELSVQGFETAGGVGGTWWWNGYPGSRCDIESVHYSYSFSDELQREWGWTEKFAGQKEILAYLEWVADKLDVRRAFRFGTRVTSLTWDEASARWTVCTDDGATCTARFVISGVGGLSMPKQPDFPGADTFQGELYWTSNWPHQDVDLTGKRVAVVGTGSSGVQVVPAIADKVQHLTVFQRTPNYVVPLRNAPVSPEEQRWNAQNWRHVRAGSRESPIGMPYERPVRSALEVSPEERRRVYDKYWARGAGHLIFSSFNDLMVNPESNETAAAYIRERIRERVQDPVTAESLIPTGHPYGSRRPVFDTNYYEAFNLPHVDLVDVRSAPIEAITPMGIRTTQASYEFDVIIMAIGFDAFSGAFLAIPTTGRDGVTLQDKWADGPVNYLGMQASGLPNLFMIIAPLSSASQYNTPLLIEDQVDFAADAVRHVLAKGARSIDTTADVERKWTGMVSDFFNMTLLGRTKSSYYMGGNIPGKPQVPYSFPAGATYRAFLAQVAETGFAGFAIDGADNAVTNIPPLLKLDPTGVLLVTLTLGSGAKPLEHCSIEETRALLESLGRMQLPGPDLRVVEVADPRSRLYFPGGEGPLPVVVFLHGGGFVGGSVELVDPTCRTLAARLEAVVVSVAYRLAPENPCPAAPEDAFAALRWVHEHIDEYGGDPSRIALMGESSGGNIATVTALRARDENIPLVAQVLVNPPIDPDADTASRVEFTQGPVLTVAAGEKFWNAYLGGAEVTAQAVPSRASSLAGVAPALVITMEVDPIRDEGEDYARALAAAGVPVERHRLDGLPHGALTLSAVLPRAQEIYRLTGDFLATKFSGAVAVAQQ